MENRWPILYFFGSPQTDRLYTLINNKVSNNNINNKNKAI